MKGRFKAIIYKTGINACVDVPISITQKMTPDKGYIRIQGEINGMSFNTTLVPVKNGPYRLFVNIPMLKDSRSVIGDTAEFFIQQDEKNEAANLPVPLILTEQLNKKNLMEEFNRLTAARRKDILKYLNNLKTEEALERNVEKVIRQLERKNSRNVRIP